jgi:hypothetical protein
MSNFTIEQFIEHANQYEPLPEGEFDTEQGALSAMQDLEANCGFTGLRIVDSDGCVVTKGK